LLRTGKSGGFPEPAVATAKATAALAELDLLVKIDNKLLPVLNARFNKIELNLIKLI
jgi:hypothetical protein